MGRLANESRTKKKDYDGEGGVQAGPESLSLAYTSSLSPSANNGTSYVFTVNKLTSPVSFSVSLFSLNEKRAAHCLPAC